MAHWRARCFETTPGPRPESGLLVSLAMEIKDISVQVAETAASRWPERAEGVHRQLRPNLPADYAKKMRRVFADGGRMCIAVEGEDVLGVAVYRIFENTVHVLKMYVD